MARPGKSIAKQSEGGAGEKYLPVGGRVRRLAQGETNQALERLAAAMSTSGVTASAGTSSATPAKMSRAHGGVVVWHRIGCAKHGRARLGDVGWMDLL